MVIGRCRMRPLTMVFACAFLLALGLPAAAADSKVKAATKEVESGAKKVGQGVEETAKGIGKTVVEGAKSTGATRSEEHTSELQSLAYLVCRLLLEKKKKKRKRYK